MKRLDPYVIASCVVLLALGLSTLYSIGATSNENYLARQIVFVVLGALVFFLGYYFDYRVFASRTRILYALGIIFLLLVLFFARNVRGSARWLEFGFFNFQPVEFVKIVLILSLARFFAVKRHGVKSASVLFHSSLVVILPVILVMLQPDLGSALLLVVLWFALLLATPVRKSQIAVLVLILALVAAGGWFGILHDYQKDRIATFLNPQADPQGSGYNVRQSIIAVGSGQIFGRGLGRGYQSHLQFLPERHTDFIFASFSEEMGFLGALLMIAAFSVLTWRLIITALKSADLLGLYLCLGVVFLLVFQIFINIGMNIGLLPVTGIPLPLVSYGGSSMLSTLFLLGLTQSVYKRAQAVL